ncbi:hypothetical protein [Halocatena pleomorpha]|uniref:DUF8052 domain-containing protein n=1 Tax=Halocatena pleomorpha TaxID=1785090 RepID=A0A3P3RF25_9EURY|nr:hypothetical protein [Halocatena pleomorpha]RRJ31013.1 hypothetical protein EIK79_08355 [Halocatena pleomorpha]
MTHDTGSQPAASSGDADASEDDAAYLHRVADRLEHSYDLDWEHRVHGEPFELYGRLQIEHQKQFLHPSITYADHGSQEHLFIRRASSVERAALDRLVELGHTLAEEWIKPDETHYSTEFTFVLIAPEITDAVRTFVDGFRDRTLLKLGFHGHYEVNLLVVAPERQTVVASTNAEVEAVFAPWDTPEPETGWIDRVVRRLRS